MTTLILTHTEVRALLDMPLAMQAVEAAFRAHGEGRASMPAKVYLDVPAHQGDFRAMPALLGEVAGVKWVNSHPHNRARHGLPTVMGTYVLSDPATALPLAVMDATWLTAFRTGAAAGVATKYLAQAGFDRVGFVGSGVQARMLRDALATLGTFEVWAADQDDDAARRFAAETGGRAVSLAEAAGCPVVCTATPSYTPVVQRAWVEPGTHINAMGADGPGKQELETQILLDARILIDEHEQATHSGELNVPYAAGLLTDNHIAASLGAVVAGTLPGRTSPSQITVFDSTGLAIQDLALADAVYHRALERGVGQAVQLVPGRREDDR